MYRITSGKMRSGCCLSKMRGAKYVQQLQLLTIYTSTYNNFAQFYNYFNVK